MAKNRSHRFDWLLALDCCGSALELACQESGVLDPGAGLTGAAQVIVTLARNMGIDEVDAEQKRFKKYFDWLFCQYAELVVAIQPAALLILRARLANLRTRIEIKVHRTVPGVHARHHQHPRIGQ